MYDCVIIDDEPHAIEGLSKYIENFGRLNIKATYSDSLMALKSLENEDGIDLIFVDIDMPRINGIELSKKLRSKTKKLVFTTGHPQYGYDAFKLEADDYLLKPYTLGEFLISMNKLFPEKNTEFKYDRNSTFLVRSKEETPKILSVKFSEVVAVESKLNYVMIHTTKRQILTYMTLKEISEILNNYPGFLQFQRSFIISEEYIESISGNSIRMVNGCEMTVGEYYRKNFTLFLEEKLIKTKRR
jgi:DNA-binding LytR/AlgR family response regulator